MNSINLFQSSTIAGMISSTQERSCAWNLSELRCFSEYPPKTLICEGTNWHGRDVSQKREIFAGQNCSKKLIKYLSRCLKIIHVIRQHLLKIFHWKADLLSYMERIYDCLQTKCFTFIKLYTQKNAGSF